VAQDFSNPVTYTVTAEDGSTQDYLVTIVNKAGQISKADQTAFSAGGDQNKLVNDDDFTQAASGVEGTGTTSYLSSNTNVATVDTVGLVHIVGAGSTQITATNSGDENYNAASDSYLLTVSKLDQIAFTAGCDQNKLFTDDDFIQAASRVEGTGVTSYLSSNTDVATVDATGVVHIAGAGTTVITATNSGDENYNGASDSFLLTVEKANQTSFSAGSDLKKLVTDADFTQAATGVEGTETTSYESSDTNVATVDADGLVHIVGAGTAEITASNPGDENYHDASDSYLLVVIIHPEFITTWQTDDEGTITIPVLSDEMETYEYDYFIDWGDGNFDTDVEGTITHTYSTPGIYAVGISGDFPAIHFASNPTEALKILTIEQWGGIKWKSMAGAFYGCENLEYNATDTPDLSEVTNMSSMFYGAAAFDGDLGGWDVSNVTDMSFMFNMASSFNGDISGWDVGNVTNMYAMFSAYDHLSWGAVGSSFDGDISDWDVGNVTDMGSMFDCADSFNGDISGWDVGNVTDMDFMFFNAAAFDGDLSDWNVSNVKNMYGMFWYASSFNCDLSGWNVSNVEDMSGMFSKASSFNGDISGWDVSNVKNMPGVFSEASSFNGDISGWDVSNVTTMFRMFDGASSFNSDLSDWDVSNVKDMSKMFREASSFNGDICGWNVGNVTDMSYMFYSATSFSNHDLSSWDVSNVTRHEKFSYDWGRDNTEPNWP
jgi:surface protein